RFAVDVMVKQADLSSINVIVDLHRDLHDRHIVVDVLINNAGYGLQGAFLDEPLESSLAMTNLDVASLTAMTRLFAENMRARRKGHILMVASLLSYQGVKHFAVYSAAKAFVLRFSDALHRELKPDGVVVTALCPGMSDTGFAA
ncbi:short-chain dehydrogenase, partial [Pseudomonas sp. MWU12-2115]|uniref:SDR family NAD(P)-dependent oxidoreductase n=1 Tax=Pseudomonas sp. MWU12-2115 TaxID=2071713 RepID=UPI000DDB64A1